MTAGNPATITTQNRPFSCFTPTLAEQVAKPGAKIADPSAMWRGAKDTA
ncbi:hypothetical protein RGUI_1817 [Rhodovulum sp. P5]|nr:hypothetical protein RGUI_1817 [Rhodovulum sp. P5]